MLHIGIAIGDAAFVSHVVVEAADVGEEVIGIREEDEASSRTERSPKTLLPVSHIGSQEMQFWKPIVLAHGALIRLKHIYNF
jgi:hypothetical protein